MADQEYHISNYLTQDEFQQFLSWWHAGGGSGIRGVPHYDDGIWDNPKFTDKLMEWAYLKSQEYNTDYQNYLPQSLWDYWNYFIDDTEQNYLTPLDIYAVKRDQWNQIKSARINDDIPGWNNYLVTRRQQLENNIQTYGRLMANNIVQYTDDKGQAHYYKNITGNGLTEIPQNLLSEYLGESQSKYWDVMNDWSKQQQDQKQWQSEFDYKKQQDAISNQLQQQQLALQQQQYNANLKANPRNWIEAWYLENPNAGRSTEGSVSSARQDWTNALNKYNGLKDQKMAEITQNGAYGSDPQYVNDLSAAQKDVAYYRQNLEDAKVNAEEGYAQREPSHPTTLPWMSSMGLVTNGKDNYVTNAKPIIASGQTWNLMPYSQQQQMLGLVDAVGSKYGMPTGEDYESYIKANLPKKSWQSSFRPAWQV